MVKKLAIILSFPAFLAAARFVPFDRLPSTCAFFHISGYPCPTCGVTRSIIALTHLNPDAAVKLNPLGPVLAGLFGVWWLVSLYQFAMGRQTRLFRWAQRKVNLLAVVGLLILLAFGALRIVSLVSH